MDCRSQDATLTRSLPYRPALLFLFLLGIVRLAHGADVPASAQSLAGHWEGEIEIPGTPLAVLVDLQEGPEGWTGTADIPLQNAAGLPLEGIALDGTTVRFAIVGIPGSPSFEGRLVHPPQGDSLRIEGTFRQGGVELPFYLGREAIALPQRPQNPKPPFPYRAEEVKYRQGDVELAATLTLPLGQGPFPAAILITGSGPQDRDETLLGHKPFWVLADHLTRAGIAVLRADDRGVGGSTGDLRSSTSSDFADDALAGVRFLGQRQDIDATRIGLIGHSEGGLVAPLAAARSEEVAFVVMMAGPGVPGLEILKHQSRLIDLAQGATQDEVEKRLALLSEGLTLLAQDPPAEDLRDRLLDLAQRQLAFAPEEERKLAEANPELVARQVDVLLTPWFRFFLTYDPAATLERVRVPVLSVTGEKDLQVDPKQNQPVITRALGAGGNRDATIETLPALNHLFQHSETGNPDEYGTLEETLAPQLLARVTIWILERFGEVSPQEGG